MKITAILETNLKAGGAHNQSLSALHQMNLMCNNHFDFIVFAFDIETVRILNERGFNSVLITFSLFDKVKMKLMLSKLSYKLFSNKTLFPIEKRLLSENTNLVYFIGPSLFSLQLKKLNYIFTLFDLAHRNNPEFDEVRIFNEFENREKLYKRVLSKSYLTLTDSEDLSSKASLLYGIDKSRFISMPFSPSPDLDHNSISISEAEVIYKLPKEYFFYPAQFWPHKNHFRILEALFILKKRNINFHLVLSGGDKGNLDYILTIIDNFGLNNFVHIIGLVPSNHMKALYQGSVALIMPTYFGPTNLPPLEAWILGTPLIYSKYLKGQSGEAALKIDPDDSESIASAMQKVYDIDIRNRLIAEGFLKINEIDIQRKEAESILFNKLITLNNRLKCWQN
jgi:glycosyltransferase involved in cell wall biosynthesis